MPFGLRPIDIVVLVEPTPPPDPFVEGLVNLITATDIIPSGNVFANLPRLTNIHSAEIPEIAISLAGGGGQPFHNLPHNTNSHPDGMEPIGISLSLDYTIPYISP